tara:strand:+ start:395 stop:1411 length:1017 start_codon:yes stop_codon:yes gene_type:complete
MKYYNKHFSHIYVERDCLHYSLTTNILNKFNKSELVYIDNYKDLFFRRNQSFDIQKRSKALILSKKRDSFIYDGSHFAQDAGHSNFFYNTLMHNCIYDCSYCYLQGMYPSSNLISFVNIHDFTTAATKAIQSRNNKNQPLFLSLSYDTDLLATENIIPYCRKWIEFAYTTSSFIGEIRTKSSSFKQLNDLQPTKRILFSWTLSPPKIVKLFESGTPSFESRLSSIHDAISNGWIIRLCFDPVITVSGWESLYEDCVHRTLSNLPINQIHDITIGVFRMSSDFLRLARARRPHIPLLQQDWDVSNGVASDSQANTDKVNSFMINLLSKWVPKSSISCWN